jgi:nitrate/nitrite transporter NarK
VFRPSFAPSPSQRAIGRTLALDLVAAIGVGVTMALISSLLPTIARRGGLEPLGLSALAAAPFVANLLGAFAGRVGPRSPRQVAGIRGVGAGALVLLVLTPNPIVMVLGALAAFAGGLIADRLGGPPAVAIAGVIGVVCAVAYTGVRARSAEGTPRFSARESLRALRERPVLGRMALAQGFYGGGFIAAAPLFALVYVDRLDLSLADVGVIGILTAASTTIAFPLWGAVADRFGALTVLRFGGSVGLCALVAYALAPHVVVLWLAALAAGTASASIDVGIAAVVSEQTPLAARAAAMAGWNAFTGARGIVAAFLMSSLLQLGVVDVTSGLLLCAVATAVGVGLYARAKPGVPVDSRAWELAPARPSPA